MPYVEIERRPSKPPYKLEITASTPDGHETEVFEFGSREELDRARKQVADWLTDTPTDPIEALVEAEVVLSRATSLVKARCAGLTHEQKCEARLQAARIRVAEIQASS